MREIKFRQWLSECKEMTYGSGMQESERGWVGFSKVNFVDNPIMQYTGLKDVHGKEIYEGDVCRYKDDSGTIQRGVVKDRGYLSIYIEAIDGDEEGNQDIELHPDYKSEVIGNIYENPELLRNSHE